MVIYLDDYRKARAARLGKLQRRYGQELTRAICNPAVVRTGTSSCQHAGELSPQLPEDLESVDVNAFLDRVYTFASRV